MQLRKLSTVVAALLVSMLFTRPSIAWEYEDAVPLPRPYSPPAKGVDLKGVSISLQGLSVTIENEIHNTTGKPFKNSYAIYLPPFSWSGVAADNGEQDFPELKIETSQGPIAVKRNVIALNNGRPITNALNSAKIDPLLVSRGDEAVLGSSELRTRAAKDLVPTGAFKEIEGVLLPQWHAQVSYGWSLRIPPERTSLMRISYRARPEFAPVAYPSPKLTAMVGRHCATMEQLHDALQSQGLAIPSWVVFRRIEIPFGLANEFVTEATVKTEMNAPYSGLKAAVSFACSGNNDQPTLIGKPSLKSSIVLTLHKQISILVIYPQQ